MWIEEIKKKTVTTNVSDVHALIGVKLNTTSGRETWLVFKVKDHVNYEQEVELDDDGRKARLSLNLRRPSDNAGWNWISSFEPTASFDGDEIPELFYGIFDTIMRTTKVFITNRQY